ncbi:tandem large repeat [Vibrio coralliilyticus]|uniref:tandem large repeat n=1 Tax=Vibrio coralliilyticus TaxID=190893 RepID=UPI00240900BF|nr:tandem large repeat [Vibrio coralliilyticus]WFB50706.1 tandem large repeat [Vibrio coralliilyticus]
MPIERHFDYYNSAKYLSEFLFSYQKFATTLTIFPYLVVIRRVVIISAKNILEPLFLQRHFGTMLRFTNKIKLILTILSILSLSSCGGGGGDGDSSPQSRKTGTITGTVFDAPISGGVVTAYEYKNGVLGRELGQTKTNASGEYTLSVDSASMPVYIKVQGGGYRDPFSNNVVRTSSNGVIELASVINFSEGETAQVMITPMTYMVQGLAEYKIKREGQSASSAINSALSTINSMYGFNVNTVNPIDITTGGHDAVATDGHKYGALLTAYSSYAYSFLENDSTGAETYTSINLARIGYDDIVADGLLDGKVLDDSRDFLEDARFGTQYITSDFYTHSVAEHTLIVVSDPNVNVSGTPVNQYETTVNHLNNLGTSGGEGSIPSRQPQEMDKNAPTAKRSDTSVLVGTESMEVTLEDETGVEGLSVTVKYLAKNTSDPSTGTEVEVLCEQDTASICWLDKTSFVKGPRKTTLKVFVNTTSLDERVVTGTVDANLIVRTVDVLNNEDNSGIELPFKWDNIKPVIEFTSSESIQSKAEGQDSKMYVLKGIVKEALNDIVDQSVYLTIASSGDPIKIECKELNTQCQFSHSYDTELFSVSVEFTVAATDIYGNKGEASFTVYKDDQKPQLSLTFSEALFEYKRIDGSRYPALFEQNTFPPSVIDSQDQYLDIDFALATSGLNETHQGLNYKDFEPSESVLQSNSIPYFIATIKDLSDRNTYGSSADDLIIIVEYMRKRSTEKEYSVVSTKTQVASEAFDDNSGIPFKRLEPNSDGRSFSMDYYLPLTADLLSGFSNASEGDSQLIQVSVEDPAGNASTPQQVYFKSTFERPTLTIITPFVGAIATVEGWNDESKQFEQIQSCTEFTKNSTNVASCSMPYNTRIQFYSLFRVTLQNGQDTYYHQWSNSSKDDAVKYTADFADAAGAIGTYFTKAETKTIYLTEFSAYHTGLFEYLWNKSAKTVNDAETILTDVAKAIAGDSDSKPLLGFDPFSSRYATNENMTSVPDNPATAYQYRILLESLASLSSETTSLEYAFAFYKDLKADGLANGNAESGSGSDSQKPIQVGDKYISINADTYRENLAKGYYDLAVSYGVDSQNAVAQADVFATANPTIDDTPIFKDAGGSIDNEPPMASVKMESGRFSEDSANVYSIAGKVYALIEVTDISGVDLAASEFKVYWYGSDGTTKKEASIVFEEASGDTYKKVLKFSIDSTNNALYKGVTRFEAYAKVLKDVKNNTTNEEVLLATFRVDNAAPIAVVENTDPINPVDDSKVEVTVTFNEPVTKVEATIDDINIDFGSSNQTKTKWVGTSLDKMRLEVNETSKSIKIKNTYSDALGNAGEQITASVGVKPVVAINDVAIDNVIDDNDNISAVVISGTTKGMEAGAKLSLAVASTKDGRKDVDKYDPDDFKDLEVQIDGTWSQTVSFQTWEEANVSITVSGKNDHNVPALQTNRIVEYKDKVPPSLSESGSMIQMSGGAETSLADSVLVHGETAKVTLKFSERVTEPTASLNYQSITFDQPDGDVSDQWVGHTEALDLPVNASTAKLEVSGYQDTANEPNPGSFSKDIDLKPIIAINHIDSFNSDSELAKSFVISGTSKGIQNGAKLTIKVYLKDELKYQHEDVQVTNGVWTLDPKNISTWESGDILITAEGKNGKDLEADKASLTIKFIDNIQPQVLNVTNWLPVDRPVHNSQPSFKVTFSEPVKEVKGTFASQRVTFSKSGSEALSTEWTGNTDNAITVQAGSTTLTLVVSSFKDASNNDVKEAYQEEVTIKPEITISTVMTEDKVDETELGNVTVSGSSIGFAESGETVKLTLKSGDAVVYEFSGAANIAADGAWSFTTDWRPANLTVGSYTVEVTGTNAQGIGASQTRTLEVVDSTEPKVLSVAGWSPEEPVHNSRPSFKVTFSEPVKEVKGTFASQRVTFSKSGSEALSTEWTGNTDNAITVQAGSTTLTLVVSSFKDASNNDVKEAYQEEVTIKPEITISTVMTEDKVDETELGNVTVSGSSIGFAESGETVKLTLKSGDAVVYEFSGAANIAADGAWSFTTDWRPANLTVGSYTVEVTGTNAQGIGASQTRTLEVVDSTEPKVLSVAGWSPEEPVHNSRPSFKVTFSEPVKEVKGTFASQRVTFSKSGSEALSTEWTGNTDNAITVQAGSTTLTLVVSSFKDASNNDVKEAYQEEVTIKPEITISTVMTEDKVDETELGNVTVSGSSIGFAESGETVKLTLKSGDAVVYEFSGAANIAADGAWSFTTDWRPANLTVGSYTVEVTGTNAQGIGASQTRTLEVVDSTEPKVLSVAGWSPEEPVHNSRPSFKVTFSEPVKEVKGTFASQRVTFSKSGSEALSTEWTGNTDNAITVQAGSTTLTLVVSSFKDASNNDVKEAYQEEVTIKPEITISTVMTEDKVDETELGNVTVSGSSIGFAESGETVKLTLKSGDAVVYEFSGAANIAADGAWSFTTDWRPANLTVGSYTVEVTGTNAQGIGASQTRTLEVVDSTEPKVLSVAGWSPEEPVHNSRPSFKVTFSEPVKEVKGTFASQRVTFSKSGSEALSTEWTGNTDNAITVQAGSTTLTLVVSSFKDASNNDVKEAYQEEVTIKPEITISTVMTEDKVDETELGNVTVSGSSIGFAESGETVKLTLKSGDAVVYEFSGAANIAADGAWSFTTDWRPANLTVGSYTVEVTGTNAQGIGASQTRTLEVVDSTEPKVLSVAGWSPEEPVHNSRPSFKVTFSEPVKEVKGTFASQRVTFSKSGSEALSTEWTGNTDNAITVQAGSTTLTLVVSSFKDASNNDVKEAYQEEVTIKPEITISTVMTEDKVDETELGNVTVSGSSIGFAESGETVKLTLKSGDAVVYEFSGAANIAADGAWSFTTDWRPANLTVGSYTVEVTGTNAQGIGASQTRTLEVVDSTEPKVLSVAGWSPEEPVHNSRPSFKVTFSEPVKEVKGTFASQRVTFSKSGSEALSTEWTGNTDNAITVQAGSTTLTLVVSSFKDASNNDVKEAYQEEVTIKPEITISTVMTEDKVDETELGNVTVSGSSIGFAESGETVKLTLKSGDAVVYEFSGAANIAADGAWSFTTDWRPANLTVGSYTVEVTGTNAQGIGASQTRTLEVVDSTEPKVLSVAGWSPEEPVHNSRPSFKVTFSEPVKEVKGTFASQRVTFSKSGSEALSTEWTGNTDNAITVQAGSTTLTLVVSSFKDASNNDVKEAYQEEVTIKPEITISTVMTEDKVDETELGNVTVSGSSIGFAESGETVKLTLKSGDAVVYEFSGAANIAADGAWSFTTDWRPANLTVGSYTVEVTGTNAQGIGASQTRTLEVVDSTEPKVLSVAGWSPEEPVHNSRPSFKVTFSEPVKEVKGTFASQRVTFSKSGSEALSTEWTGNTDNAITVQAGSTTLTLVVSSFKDASNNDVKEAYQEEVTIKPEITISTVMTEDKVDETELGNVTVSGSSIGFAESGETVKLTLKSGDAVVYEFSGAANIAADGAWSFTTDWRPANLTVGSYTVEVKGTNAQGIGASQTRSIEVI